MTAAVIALGDRDERYLTHRELDATERRVWGPAPDFSTRASNSPGA